MLSNRRGFTLIEILVTITIIGLLIAILLPAVQSAREAARRASCSSNLRQLGLAIHQYQAAHGVIVPGRIWGEGAGGCSQQMIFGKCQNSTWFPLLLPFVEQQFASNAFNFQLGAEGAFPVGVSANSTVMSTRMSITSCPSDRQDSFQFPAGSAEGIVLSRGNYGASWGNGIWLQVDMGSKPPLLQLTSAFGHKGNVSIAAVSDGLSSTVFISEILQGTRTDARGLIWSPMAGSSLYMTRFAPNGFRDLVGGPNAGDAEDTLLAPYCYSDIRSGLPCQSDAELLRTFAGARSRHPNGVNSLMGDGSTRFVKNGVNHSVWLAINSISGGEILDASSY